MAVAALEITEAQKKLLHFLETERLLTQEQLREAQEDTRREHRPLEETLLQKGWLPDPELGQAIAEAHGWNFVNLRNEGIEEPTLRLIPEAFARHEQTIAFQKSTEGIKVALSHPEDPVLRELIEKRLEAPLIPYFSTPKDLAENLGRYDTKIEEEFSRLIAAQAREAAFAKSKDSAIVKLVNLLVTHGYKKKASDIHLDPQEDGTLVRFRMDGVLYDIAKIPLALHELVITRIKVMSKMHTDEHQVPQDGKISFSVNGNGETVDVRVSVMPTTKGENAVLRLLAEKSRQLSLEDLGLLEHDFKKLNTAIQKPWGMILVTGPTGSGKTTSLYAALKILNTRDVNIATIEDPVEYNIVGVTQIQVNPKAKLTFASGLRSIVRQDPDIIMVGEIRDSETADIAVNSAMTGHLVLSTLHTNDAATALPRLLEMDIERFLVASTVNLIVAQRLVRRICTKCIETVQKNPKDFANILPSELLERLKHFYQGAGCNLCAGSGFAGRIGVFEMLEVTDSIRKLIMQNADADQVRRAAMQEGMTTMLHDALEKVTRGMTTIEEVLRIVKS